MASSQQVRAYLAHWFQLGKSVILQRSRRRCLPNPIFYHETYSSEFEDCWRDIQAVDGQDCYLEGTDQTIAELLSPQWEINDCSRCVMPVPMAVGTIAQMQACPCQDLPSWPNEEIPKPRKTVDSQRYLGSIRDHLQSSYDHSAGLPDPNSVEPGIAFRRQPEP